MDGSDGIGIELDEHSVLLLPFIRPPSVVPGKPRGPVTSDALGLFLVPLIALSRMFFASRILFFPAIELDPRCAS